MMAHEWPWYRDRVKRLGKAEARAAAYVTDPEHYQFRVAVSCPPDTRLHMRGGLMYDQYDGDAQFVADETIDLTDPAQMMGQTYTFTVANAYLIYVLALYVVPLANEYLLLGSDVEYATAAEAEQELATLYDQDWWNVTYPLCGLVLRNDGTVGTGYHILPVDRVNRGRSYVWPADMRPRNIAL